MEFDKSEGLSPKQLKRSRKHLAREADSRRLRLRKTRQRIAWGILLILAIGGVFIWLKNRQVLPPTDIAGHIEKNPPAHILDEPMPLEIQKHMLEHADGDGSPGVIINYNCEDFACESDLQENLKQIAEEYPEYVYLAPFPGMTKKIAVTRVGKIQSFDSIDRDALHRFIGER
jgi:hypothetical protein